MIYRFLKNQVLSFFILFITLSNSYSEIVKSIDILGNNRVNTQTIKIFGGVSLGDDLNKNDLNNILKKLYDTNFFKNVDISLNQSVLSISVEENPIVQNLIVQGIKNKDLDKSIKEIPCEIWRPLQSPLAGFRLHQRKASVLSDHGAGKRRHCIIH